MEENKKINVKSNTQGNTQENADASTAKKKCHSDSPPKQSKASTNSKKQVNLNRNKTSSTKMAVAYEEDPDVVTQEIKTNINEYRIMKTIDNEPANNESPQCHGCCFVQEDDSCGDCCIICDDCDCDCDCDCDD